MLTEARRRAAEGLGHRTTEVADSHVLPDSLLVIKWACPFGYISDHGYFHTECKIIESLDEGLWS